MEGQERKKEIYKGTMSLGLDNVTTYARRESRVLPQRTKGITRGGSSSPKGRNMGEGEEGDIHILRYRVQMVFCVCVGVCVYRKEEKHMGQY